ncbi:hypothetical protein [uncultured Alistipes sp.]|jgi:lipoprotein|uniref:hypothetical protein n=1 Tax=uncultured Alistipes sp. TaxID=538949 RepID=UPI0025F4943E|nr:hypothetical protein [uncultured Alistipes sp.]
MKNFVYTLGAACMLLAAACGKDDPKTPVDPSVQSYEFVSVEYELLQTLPIREVIQHKVIRNDRGVTVKAQYSHRTTCGYSSVFMPDASFVGDLDGCKIPVPEVDRDGNAKGNFFIPSPLAFGEVYTYTQTSSENTIETDLPPHMQYNITVTREACGVEAAFTCRLYNTLSDKVEEVKGRWSGAWEFGSYLHSEVSELE